MLTSETQHVWVCRTAAIQNWLVHLWQGHKCISNVSTQALQQHIELLAPLFTAAPAPACDHARWCVPSPGTIIVIKS